MFARLGELADRPLSAARHPRERLVGCCRDFTVLFLAMARRKGIPVRARVGFAGYFADGWLIDHVITEVWDGSAQRWRLVEPEIADGHTDPADGASFDPLDVPVERFLTAPRAIRSAYRRPGFVVPDTVTMFSPARTDVPAVVDVSAVARSAVS